MHCIGIALNRFTYQVLYYILGEFHLQMEQPLAACKSTNDDSHKFLRNTLVERLFEVKLINGSGRSPWVSLFCTRWCNSHDDLTRVLSPHTNTVLMSPNSVCIRCQLS